MPIGTSIKPVFLIFPARANTLVPALFGVPMPANQALPRRMIGAMFAKVSTLLMSVGDPHNPLSAG
jgi:hypothetical protein